MKTFLQQLIEVRRTAENQIPQQPQTAYRPQQQTESYLDRFRKNAGLIEEEETRIVGKENTVHEKVRQRFKPQINEEQIENIVHDTISEIIASDEFTMIILEKILTSKDGIARLTNALLAEGSQFGKILSDFVYRQIEKKLQTEQQKAQMMRR